MTIAIVVKYPFTAVHQQRRQTNDTPCLTYRYPAPCCRALGEQPPTPTPFPSPQPERIPGLPGHPTPPSKASKDTRTQGRDYKRTNSSCCLCIRSFTHTTAVIHAHDGCRSCIRRLSFVRTTAVVCAFNGCHSWDKAWHTNKQLLFVWARAWVV